jgi:predicted AAA+ superfamily ATPase
VLRRLADGSRATEYATMDSLTTRERAARSPEAFTEPSPGTTILDEIQKVPDLFDAIKLHVDSRRRPGMFLISGSTEFSRMTGIRESLTGRIGILRMYPLTRSELHETVFQARDVFTKPMAKCSAAMSLKQYDTLLSRGGMPGLCFIRADEEFAASVAVWLETTCSRDLQQIATRKKYENSFALAVLREVAIQEEPTALSIAQRLRKDTRVIQGYLDALEAILVVHRLPPHPAGVGKAQYHLIDPGLIGVLGGSREQQVKSQLITELLAMSEAQGLGRPQLYAYRNEKTSRVPLIAQWMGVKVKPLALQFYEGETLPRAERDALLAFSKRARMPGLRLMALTHAQTGFREDGIETLPLRF